MNKEGRSGGIVGISDLQIKINVNGDNSSFDLEWRFPIGHGVSTDYESGLLRPLKFILFDGKPIGKINCVFYEDDGTHYVVGTLCKSKQKLLFFTGGNRGQLIPNDNVKLGSAHIDHFTLDENYETWHVTLKEKAAENKKIPQERTWKINDGLILWFVLQARSVDDFEKMPSILRTSLKHKESEVKRRQEEIMKARKDSLFQICKVNNDVGKPYVINFEFFLSFNEKPNLRTIPIYYNTPNHLMLNGIKNLPTRVHDIQIPSFDPYISIRVTKIPGTHNYPWNYNPGSKFRNSKPKAFSEN